MKKAKTLFPITGKNKVRIFRMADGILTVGVLVFIFMAFTLIQTEFSTPAISYFIAYVLFAASYGLQAVANYKKSRLEFIKYLICAVILAAAAAVYQIVGLSVTGIVVLMESFFAVLLVNRVLAVIAAKKIRRRVINVLLSIFLLYLIISSVFVNYDHLEEFLLIHAVLIAGRALGHIIAISFSQIRLGVLRKIMRKTFAAEIIFGLLLLIFSFSFVFQAIEPTIETYFDALWYCFAVVTTIGFGDYSVASLLSRALSVILGVYGIVVVALITSVIVNFYNEVKDEKDDEAEANTPQAIAANTPHEGSGQDGKSVSEKTES